MTNKFVSGSFSGRSGINDNIAKGEFTVIIPNGLELKFSALDFMCADHYGVESTSSVVIKNNEWLQVIEKYHRDINFQRLHHQLLSVIKNNRYLWIDEVSDAQSSDTNSPSFTQFEVSKINENDVKVANNHLKLISSALKTVIISSPCKHSRMNFDCDQLRYETNYGDFIFHDSTIECIMKEISDILSAEYCKTIETINNIPDPIIQDVQRYIEDVCGIIEDIIETNEANAEQVMHIYQKYVFNIIHAKWSDD